jgi:hypothetical protein
MKRSSANPVKSLGGIDSYTKSQDQFAAERYIRYNSDPVVDKLFSSAWIKNLIFSFKYLKVLIHLKNEKIFSKNVEVEAKMLKLNFNAFLKIK